MDSSSPIDGKSTTQVTVKKPRRRASERSGDEAGLDSLLSGYLAALGVEAHDRDVAREMEAWLERPLVTLTVRDIGLLVEAVTRASTQLQPASAKDVAVSRAGALMQLVSATELRHDDADAWVYDAVRWELVAPSGRCALLSLAESQVVRCLFSHSGTVVSRDDLLVALNRPRLEAYSRNLDVTVSRLRKKVIDHCGQKLPILSARGLGYVFSAPSRIR